MPAHSLSDLTAMMSAASKDGHAGAIGPSRRIPVYVPDLGGNERAYVLECMESTWISSKGAFIGRFEAGFARFAGAHHAASTCNGTTALHLALLALGLGAGDEVIVPTLTYIASANAVTYTGAKPIFVDALPGTWQMDPADVVRKITPRTRAILAVHLYGHPADIEALQAICTAHGLALVEDCAEAIGTRVKGRHVGTFGAVAAFSFFGNKTITTGEGGLVVTNDGDLHDRVCRLKGQGLARNREYWHDLIGYNYRMTNICAAIGVAQLERIDDIIAKKRAIAGLYREFLRGAPLTFQDSGTDIVHSFWMVSILTARAEDRDPLRRALAEAGIETRPFFAPIHRMPMYADGQETHPVAEDLSLRGINLPSWPGLGVSDIAFIAGKIRSFCEGGRGVGRVSVDTRMVL